MAIQPQTDIAKLTKQVSDLCKVVTKLTGKTPTNYCLQADTIENFPEITKNITIPHNFCFFAKYVSGQFSCHSSINLLVGIKVDHNLCSDATPFQLYQFDPVKTPISNQSGYSSYVLSERVWIPMNPMSGGVVLSVTQQQTSPLPPGTANVWSAHLQVHGYLVDLSS